jgi:hypothetical protein
MRKIGYSLPPAQRDHRSSSGDLRVSKISAGMEIVVNVYDIDCSASTEPAQEVAAWLRHLSRHRLVRGNDDSPMLGRVARSFLKIRIQSTKRGPIEDKWHRRVTLRGGLTTCEHDQTTRFLEDAPRNRGYRGVCSRKFLRRARLARTSREQNELAPQSHPAS